MDILSLQWYPHEKRYWYPHMGPADRQIWQRFLDRFPDAFDRVAYDVAVGTGLPLEHFEQAGANPNMNKLYQRKLDVLGYASDILTIVECKPRASTSAIGQIKGYATLFRRDYNYTGQLQLLILTDQLMPEMEFLAKNEGVNLIVV